MKKWQLVGRLRTKFEHRPTAWERNQRPRWQKVNCICPDGREQDSLDRSDGIAQSQKITRRHRTQTRDYSSKKSILFDRTAESKRAVIGHLCQRGQ